MAKRAKPEEIIAKLREVEVRLSQGESVGMAAKSIGVTEQTYYRWRKEYGGLQVNQAKRLKDMEKENARLRKSISDLMLDKQVLEEVIMDVSRFDAAPLIAFTATKETNYGAETDG